MRAVRINEPGCQNSNILTENTRPTTLCYNTLFLCMQDAIIFR